MFSDFSEYFIGLLVLEKNIFEGFTVYKNGGHLGHVTKTNFINLCLLYPKKLHIKFGFDV